jgi:hypothetical protein
MIESFLSVFGLALIELWAAIPLGFHLKLHPVLLAVAASAGALGGAAAAMFVGDRLRRLIFWRKNVKAEAGRMSKWLVAKGPWAIGLLGPLLIGPVFAAGLAGAIGLPRAFSLALLAVGIVVWTIIFVTLGTFGLAALH